jgi:hypothetical protein
MNINLKITHLGGGEWDGIHRCRVCKQVLQNPPATAEPGFCPTCLALYAERQRTGVSTVALDARWLDTLATWHGGKPESLHHEPHAQHFAFCGNKQEWLLFSQGYQERLPDWVAFHVPTGEVRRFQDEGENEVLTALLGSWPPPAVMEQMQVLMEAERQKALAELLHTPPPVSLGIGRPTLPTVAELLEEASFQVYGLAIIPPDLAVRGPSTGHSEQVLTSVGFTYASPHYPAVRKVFELTSSATSNPMFHLRRPPAAEEVFWQGAYQVEGQELRGRVSRAVVSGKYASRFPHWVSEGEVVVQVDLASEETLLTGLALGLSVEAVLDLLHNLVVLKHRADLMARYQQDLDEEMQRLFGL